MNLYLIFLVKISQKTKHNKQRSAEIVPDLDMIYNAIQEMLQLTDTVIGYVDDVLVSVLINFCGL